MLNLVDGRALRSRRRRAGRPRHAGPRRPVPVRGVLLAAAVVAAGAVWLSGHRTVTLMVDGEVSRHETHAATVGDFLARTGVGIGADDRVTPEPGASLRDGMHVEVVHARAVTLLLGDEARRVVASALTVDDLLDELGSAATHGRAGATRRLVRPSRLARVRPGMVVELTDPVALTVVHDGGRQDVVTTERTVGDVLDRLGIALGPSDRVTPPPAERVEHGLEVTVERVDVAVEVREVPVAFEVVKRATSRLPRGERRVVRAGRDGRIEVTEAVATVDGAERERTVVAREVVAEPVGQVVEVGTAAPVAAVAAAGTTPGAGPGGEARTAPGAGPGEEAAGAGSANVQRGTASWYDSPLGGYTAAHRTLPRGTVVRVVNVANGRSVEVRVNDRGPFVPGRVIDLNRAAFAELAAPARGVVQVRIEW